MRWAAQIHPIAVFVFSWKKCVFLVFAFGPSVKNASKPHLYNQKQKQQFMRLENDMPLLGLEHVPPLKINMSPKKEPVQK